MDRLDALCRFRPLSVADILDALAEGVVAVDENLRVLADVFTPSVAIVGKELPARDAR